MGHAAARDFKLGNKEGPQNILGEEDHVTNSVTGMFSENDLETDSLTLTETARSQVGSLER
jgi:hypothetical protein